ncbi:MAG: hypothetical protein ABI617_07630 [Sphingomicrobium sp.]
MGEPKAFASLSSGLLARKGGARPAMRPQGFGGQSGGASLEDLGWNDMGFEPPKPADLPDADAEHDAFGEEVGPQPLRNPLAALTPVGQSAPIGSPVHDQHDELAAAFNAVEDEGDEDYDETAELYDGPPPEFDAFDAIGADVVPMPMRKSMALAPVDQPVTDNFAPPAVQPVAPRRAPTPRAAAGSKAKAAFTLRLDKDRHLKLRLACAVTGRSAQQLVTDALDGLLASMPELDGMANQAPTSVKRART